MAYYAFKKVLICFLLSIVVLMVALNLGWYYGIKPMMGENSNFSYQEKEIRGLPFNFIFYFKQPLLIKDGRTAWSGKAIEAGWRITEPMTIFANLEGEHQFTAHIEDLSNTLKIRNASIKSGMGGIGLIVIDISADEISAGQSVSVGNIGQNAEAKELKINYKAPMTSITPQLNFRGYLDLSAKSVSLPKAIPLPLEGRIDAVSLIMDGQSKKDDVLLKNMNLNWREAQFVGTGKIEREDPPVISLLLKTKYPEIVFESLTGSGYLDSQQLSKIKRGIQIYRIQQDKTISDNVFMPIRVKGSTLEIANQDFKLRKFSTQSQNFASNDAYMENDPDDFSIEDINQDNISKIIGTESEEIKSILKNLR